jgi:hypothetical protein
MPTSDIEPVHVPRWAFRLAGSTILMGLVAFLTTTALLFLWMALLTWSVSSQDRTLKQILKDQEQAAKDVQEVPGRVVEKIEEAKSK